MTVGSIATKYVMFIGGDWTLDFAKFLGRKNKGLLRAKNGQSVFSNISQAYERSQNVSLYRAGVRAQDFTLGKYAKGAISSWGKEISAGAESGIFGGVKGFFKGASKRMPFIGTVLTLALEVPNLYRSFTSPKGGIGTGTVETGKAAIKLGAFAGGAAAGAAIGTLIFPGVGTVAGGIIGFVGSAIGGMLAGSIADKVVGKSFTEKQEEESKLAAEQLKTEVAQPQFQGQKQARLSQAQQAMMIQQLMAAQGGQNFVGTTNPFAPDIYNMQADPMERDIMSGR